MNDLTINDQLLKNLKYLHYSPNDAIKEFLILNLSKLVAEFNNECCFYENKYHLEFKKFEDHINNRQNDENFEEYDDYMAWKFANEKVQVLKEKLNTIKC